MFVKTHRPRAASPAVPRPALLRKRRAHGASTGWGRLLQTARCAANLFGKPGRKIPKDSRCARSPFGAAARPWRKYGGCERKFAFWKRAHQVRAACSQFGDQRCIKVLLFFGFVKKEKFVQCHFDLLQKRYAPPKAKAQHMACRSVFGIYLQKSGILCYDNGIERVSICAESFGCI